MTDRFISPREICKLAGFSRATLHRLIRAEQFPQLSQLSPKRVGLLESVYHDWATSRKPSGLPRTPELMAALEKLDERRRDIFIKRRLIPVRDTRAVLAVEYGVSQERIAQLEAQAVEFLREQGVEV
jgi:predicted DNA-binding transcriptional regulator AlpA